MISHIDIKDFAIIKDLSLDLNEGLNIITGETGAGKSIIIEAISMALGSRADTDYIRKGSDKAIIAMLIDTKGEEYSIKREISANKSVCRINGELVSLAELSALCKKLVDIHGQYDHQSLLNPDNHINVLDMYGGEKLLSVKEEVKTCYEKYAQSSTRLMNLRKRLADSARQKDFLRFEVDEITKADIKIGEDEELAERIKLMENSESIFESLASAHAFLFQDGGSVSSLGNAMNALESVKGLSADLDELLEKVSNAYYEIEDMNKELRTLKDSVSFSQAELDDAIERQDLLNNLKKKYGGSLENVLAYVKEASANLTSIENADEEMASLEKEIAENKKAYDEAAERLTTLRKKTADTISTAINKELSELNFKDAVFGVKMDTVTPKENGVDTVEFLISANKGEDLKPLAKVASGGELSRIMLALKRIIGDIDGIPTMIFDEIDTGISGATAGVVGDKLKAIAEGHQVICITHLPQIASKGNHHYRIFKTSDEICTQTTVVPLNKEERIEELARLLSGTTITDTARKQAEELLSQA